MQESNQYISSIVSDEEVFRLKAKRDWDNSINTAYEIGYELGIAKSVIERLTIHKVELNPKLLIIVLDRLFSLNVTTEKIVKHTGLPADLIDDLREMRYEIGRAEGRAEGEQSKAIDIAKNLKSMGFSIADIIKATGLSEDDIKKL
ncbi:MAG: hypothetical protein ACI3ZD_06525 [Prevotella sp.]